MASQSQNTDKEVLLHAFDSARAWSSLLVTLATAGILFTATFRKDFAPSGFPLKHDWLLLTTWSTLGLSAFLGVMLLGTLTASLSQGKSEALDVYHPMLRFVAFGQVLGFIVGIGVLLAFASLNLSGGPYPATMPPTPPPP